jgi:HD superfamily phosphohydrolase
VGVYLLLRRYAAPIEEQIAGLIHDVSHTAFSHCIDYVFNSGSGEKQDFQDNIFEEYVKRSEIPEILEKYHFDLDYILDDTHFPLKEKDLPDLCADRIDYSLRTARVRNDYSADNISDILANLRAEDNVWQFLDQSHARKFADIFTFVNTKYFAGIESAVMFQTVSDYLRHALNKSYISREDIFTTDQIVLEKIARHHEADPELRQLFDRMNNKIGFKNDPLNYQRKVTCKARAVDPLHAGGTVFKRLSSTDSEWKSILTTELKPKEYFLSFES